VNDIARRDDRIPLSSDAARTPRAGELLTATQATRGGQRIAYSRFVLCMKFLLPAMALAMVVLVVLWPQININRSQFTLSFARLKAASGEFPSMINARFVGTDRRNQPFSVTADIAKSLSLNASTVELEMPKADLGLRDGSSMVLTANSGNYDQKEKTLKLQGAVNLFHDSGYEFKTAAADVDFGTGTATGSKPVEGQGPFGSLQAEGFRITNEGKRLFFTGKAKLTIHPGENGKP
jgi:lipopolysaccharide export system protein LptC